MEDKAKLNEEVVTKFLKCQLKDFPERGEFWVNSAGQPLFGKKVDFIENYQVLLSSLFDMDEVNLQYRKASPVDKQYVCSIKKGSASIQAEGYSPGIAVAKAVLKTVSK
jgi:hypothetical protein